MKLFILSILVVASNPLFAETFQQRGTQEITHEVKVITTEEHVIEPESITQRPTAKPKTLAFYMGDVVGTPEGFGRITDLGSQRATVRTEAGESSVWRLEQLEKIKPIKKGDIVSVPFRLFGPYFDYVAYTKGDRIYLVTGDNFDTSDIAPEVKRYADIHRSGIVHYKNGVKMVRHAFLDGWFDLVDDDGVRRGNYSTTYKSLSPTVDHIGDLKAGAEIVTKEGKHGKILHVFKDGYVHIELSSKSWWSGKPVIYVTPGTDVNVIHKSL